MREGWTYRKLGEICDSDLGKTLNQSKDIGDFRKYLCSINVQWDAFDLSVLKEARFEDEEIERYSVSDGDLLVCEGGDIGRAAIWKGEPMLYQNALHRIRFNDSSYLPRFYMLYLMHLKHTGELDNKYGKGVTIKHLVKSSLLSIPVPVPPMPEQERIVAELDLLSSIIEKQKRQLSEFDTLAQSIFYDMFGDPVANDKGWETKRLRDIGKIITGCTPSTKDENNYSSKDYSFIKPSDIPKGKVTFLENSEFYISEKGYSNSRQLPCGSVLVTCIGIIGKVAILTKEATCNQQINAIVPEPSILPTFLAFSILGINGFLEAMANAPVVPIINKSTFAEIAIPIPPLPIQQTFAAKITAIETQKQRITRSIAETQHLLDYTMDKYFG
ncbi:MAG: restriction endonuclease subunit S [Candidatus Cryptobacteroides sp.]